ncbi:hypothetical protein NCH01_13580 [Neoasaia chiangmaiensis]|nr:hypothetical protein NCH01_13580 [Neoasaia chiangmaiensis]
MGLDLEVNDPNTMTRGMRGVRDEFAPSGSSRRTISVCERAGMNRVQSHERHRSPAG